MLILPSGDDYLRILAIDPGTETLGTCIISVDLRDFKATIVDAATYAASTHLKNFSRYEYVEELHGSRQARLLAHRNNLMQHMLAWQPHHVASESPFMGIRPNAFAALVECVGTIRAALFEYDPTIQLNLVPPHSAKKAVGVIGRGTTKDNMRNAIIHLVATPEQSGLHYSASKSLDALDEHSIDSIAVGYFHYRQLVEYFQGESR